jgi:hypothetical protein
MESYVGLDVSLKQTSICVVNQVGSVVREDVVDSEPEAIAAYRHETDVLCVPTNVCSWWKSDHAADIIAKTDFGPTAVIATPINASPSSTTGPTIAPCGLTRSR